MESDDKKVKAQMTGSTVLGTLGVDPVSGWLTDIRMKKVLITVQPDGQPGVVTGFVAGTVVAQNGDVLTVSLEKTELDIHKQYIYKVLLDDEAIPDTLDGVPLLHY